MKTLSYIFMLGLLASSINAQEVIAADAEDLEAFDNAMERRVDNEQRREGADEFRTWVSGEAQKLRDSSLEERREFGENVSSEVRRDRDKRPDVSRDRNENTRENLPQSIRDRSDRSIGGGDQTGRRGQ